ncbi:SusE domain-containing protein [Mangrovimonas sp. TPBH4]|uniref:SusE domain-containing protein n=1 Tax=Mangrovimonas sp. TPBH4 TaxID=1645914 RepID=UPI0006B4AF95|nr:SusE domain-containing protein [Mangrovimonas sp. TPBH4]
MKQLINYCLIVATMFFVACSNDDGHGDFQISEGTFGDILTPNDGQSYTLNPFENQTNTAITITWESADYGVPTQISYIVEAAQSGTDFEEPVVIGTTSSNVLSLDIATFNGYAVGAGLLPFTEGTLDIRVKSTIGNQSDMPLYSNAITVSVTPFTTALPKLAVPGNHQGWDPPTAPLLASSAFGETDYEGYVWLDGGYKFLAPDAAGAFQWGNTDWGDDGSFTGILVADDETDCTATAGYYFVEANTGELTYATTATNWGIIGEATPTGWDSDTDLVYNSSTRTLEIDIDLEPGPFKFRANNEWSIELGSFNDDGFLQAGGDLTFDGPAGNYHVVLDLSNPREYTYSLIQN